MKTEARERPEDGLETPESFRPALVALSQDVRELTRELRDGLESEDRVLSWIQEMTIRTLGQLDLTVYQDLVRQFRVGQGVLLASLLDPAKRRGTNRDLDERRAEMVREHLLATHVLPAHRSAFRNLRKDATEYVSGADGGADADAHDPSQQRWVAMRPSLDELDDWQQRCLDRCLEGFDDRSELLDWRHDVVLATHGEVEADWTERVYREDGTVQALCGEGPAERSARRLFAAFWLLPKFRAGVRTMAGRAGEVADADVEESEVLMG